MRWNGLPSWPKRVLTAGERSPRRRLVVVSGVIDTGEVSNQFSTDWLFSYRPVPGTLVYLGYGSTLEEPREFRFKDLHRKRDGFFGKISYLFRL